MVDITFRDCSPEYAAKLLSVSASATAAAPEVKATQQEAEVKEEPKPKTKKTTKKTVKRDVKVELVPDETPELDDDADLSLDGEPELTLEDNVLPAYRDYLKAQAAKHGADKARARIKAIMMEKFGVESGRVVDLPSEHFAAAIKAIK